MVQGHHGAKIRKKIPFPSNFPFLAGLCSAVNSTSDCRSKHCESEPKLGHFTLAEIDHEIISTMYGHSPLPLKQEGQLLSVTCKSMYYLYWLTTYIDWASKPAQWFD